MRTKHLPAAKQVCKQVVFYIVLLGLWQTLFLFGVALGWWKSYAFPTPLGVWEALETLMQQNTLLPAVGFSLRRAWIGYLISAGAGLLLGFLLSRVKVLRETVKPLILGLQTLPSVCWVPFAILWFGLKESSIVFVIIVGSAFSIAIAADSAIRNVNPLYIKAAKTMGAREWNLYGRVIFPASLPALISGLKQGWSFAWRALMAGEVMSASVGLGQTLMLGRDLADINRVMLIMIVIVIVGVVIDRLVFTLIEDKLLKRIGYV